MMKKLKFLIVTLLFIVSAKINAQEILEWNTDKELGHLRNRQDSTKRNLDMLNQDLDYQKSKKNELPTNFGASPVPGSLLRESTFKEEFKLTKTERKKIIDSSIQILKEHYLFPKKANEIEKLLIKKLKTGAFESINDPKSFGKELQNLMQEVTHDKHLRIMYDPDMVKGLVGVKTKQDSLLLYKQDFEERKLSNFGLPEARILDNNIGYLKITKFTSPQMAGPKAMASSIFLQNVDGLILDLRSRGGGNSYTLELLLSYFLPPQTHLYTWHFRGTEKIEQSWTLPYVEGHRFLDIPIIILTSNKTFSASEAFCYFMKVHKRATIVGETTVGGAHTYKEMKVTDEYIMTVPYGRPVSLITNGNWEVNGVIPDYSVKAEEALEKAQELLSKE